MIPAEALHSEHVAAKRRLRDRVADELAETEMHAKVLREELDRMNCELQELDDES